jgi:3-deoxy-7-phosphoheptulonate synthase
MRGGEMVVVLKRGTGEEEIKQVESLSESLNLSCHVSRGLERVVIGVIGDDRYMSVERFEALECVEQVVRVLKPFKLVSREFHSEDISVEIGDLSVGEGKFIVMAGPCAIEDRPMMEESAAFLSEMGVRVIRGGAFKPRTSPYSFQGLGEIGLRYLREAADHYGLKTVTEVTGEGTLEAVSEMSDILQIGARNSQNFQLIQKVAEKRKPILLKKGFMNTVEELLLSAEYIASRGNMSIKLQSPLPVIVDPSHASGRRDLIIPLSRAALAVGANGIEVEVHPRPEKALSDSKQSLSFGEFEKLMNSLEQLADATELSLT